MVFIITNRMKSHALYSGGVAAVPCRNAPISG